MNSLPNRHSNAAAEDYDKNSRTVVEKGAPKPYKSIGDTECTGNDKSELSNVVDTPRMKNGDTRAGGDCGSPRKKKGEDTPECTDPLS